MPRAVPPALAVPALGAQPPPVSGPAREGRSPPRLPERLGCVTAYAILLFVGVAFWMWLSLTGLTVWVFSEEGWQEGVLLFGGLSLAYLATGVLLFLVGRGLWRPRNWARIVVIVGQVLGLAISLFAACGSLLSSATPVSVATAIIGIPVSVGVIHWFGSHRDCFW